MQGTKTIDNINRCLDSSYNLLLSVLPLSNNLDYPAFGCFYCMLLEEWCLHHNASITEVIQELSDLIRAVNSDVGTYRDSLFQNSEES